MVGGEDTGSHPSHRHLESEWLAAAIHVVALSSSGPIWQWQELGIVDNVYEDDHEEEDDKEEQRFDSPTMSSSVATTRSCSWEEEDEDAAVAHPSPPSALRRAIPPLSISPTRM